MKKSLLVFTAFSMLVAFTACEQDAPEINFTQTTTVELDLTELIEAINDMSLSTATKLDLINKALEDQNLTISQKMDLLKEVIETQGIDLNGKLTLIKEAIESAALDLNSKLTLLEKAIDGKIVESQKAIQQYVAESVVNTLSMMDPKLDAIAKNIESLNKALTLVGIEAGIQSGSSSEELLILPVAYDALHANPEIKEAFLALLKDQTPDPQFISSPTNEPLQITTIEMGPAVLFFKTPKADEYGKDNLVFKAVKHRTNGTYSVSGISSINGEALFAWQYNVDYADDYHGQHNGTPDGEGGLGAINGTTFSCRFYWEKDTYASVGDEKEAKHKYRLAYEPKFKYND